MKREAIAIINKVGAFREKEIAKNCHAVKGQWDSAHKVVILISNNSEDGHADSCEVDIATGKITG